MLADLAAGVVLVGVTVRDFLIAFFNGCFSNRLWCIQHQVLLQARPLTLLSPHLPNINALSFRPTRIILSHLMQLHSSLLQLGQPLIVHLGCSLNFISLFLEFSQSLLE